MMRTMLIVVAMLTMACGSEFESYVEQEEVHHCEDGWVSVRHEGCVPEWCIEECRAICGGEAVEGDATWAGGYCNCNYTPCEER